MHASPQNINESFFLSHVMSLEDKKKEQMSQLSEQAAILQSNLTEFDSLVRESCIQYKAIQELGLMHGALFMGSHEVFGHDYDARERNAKRNAQTKE